MKQKLTLLIVLISITVMGFSQNFTTIKGNIKDNTKAIDNATVAIIKIKDSSLVKATASDKDGNFILENVKEGNYRLMTSYVGHKKSYSDIFTAKGGTIDLGAISLGDETKSLKEVSVISKKPFIERKIDKTVINVDASILNAGGTAMEILEAAPGVSVDKDGNISLKGKAGVNIMIDGKTTYLSTQQLADYLKNMPASALDQVEIMTNPSAKYDASGNSGIINIKTKKNKMKGFNGNLSTSYGQGVSYRTNNSINLNYRNGKFNVFGNYSYSANQNYHDLNILRNFRNTDTKKLETIFDQTTNMKRNNQNHDLKVGADFYANKKTTLGVVLTGTVDPSKMSSYNRTLLEDQYSHVDSSLLAISNEKNKYVNTGVNLNFRHTYDSTGKELSADVDYITYSQSGDQLFNNFYYNGDNSMRKPSTILSGSLPSDIKIYSAKMDFSLPLKKGAKFETGIKSSYVTTDNNAIYNNFINGAWAPDYGKTNHFLYNENINAAYVNYNKQIKKWGIQTGLRLENTISTGHQLGNQVNHDSSFKRNYTGLFPTVFVSYDANKNNNFSANIGRRIDRPNYQDLNPFYYFLDDYTYQVGNTQLKPQYTNSIELSHTYKGFLTTTINYSNTKDMFSEVFKQITSERKTFVTQDNIASRRDLGIAVSLNMPIGKIWTTSIYTNVVNNKYVGTLSGGSLNVQGTVFMANVSNQFKFKKGWAADLSGWYRSKGIEGQVIADPMYQLSTGVQKDILKKKGTLKFGIRDILNSQHFTGLVKYQDIDAKIAEHGYDRTATVTFTYRFGKPMKTQQRRSNGGAGDEQNRIKKG